MPGSLYDEFKRAGEMECIGVALARFAESLSPGGQFKLGKGKRWVYRPANFVTFQVQTRKPVIVVTFSGHYVQFKAKAEEAALRNEWLKLEKVMSNYSEYKITGPGQLLAAAQFIRWGFEYKTRPVRRARTAGRSVASWLPRAPTPSTGPAG